MHRLLVTALTLICAAWLAAPVALAQDTDAATELRRTPVYVAPGAEEVDRRQLDDAVLRAAGLDLDLRVAVLASGDGEARAGALLDELPGTTVVVFTPSSYGVASDEISQGRLNDALAAAEDELSGPDAAAGLDAFVDALDGGGGPSAVVIVLAALAVLLVVAVAGRMWESRTRARRQARKRDRRRRQLSERVSGIGGRVVELSDPVELAESADASRAYAEAAAIFGEADRRLAAAATMKDLDEVEADLEHAERLLDQAATAARRS